MASGVTRSPSTTAPRINATTGFTSAYVATFGAGTRVSSHR